MCSVGTTEARRRARRWFGALQESLGSEEARDPRDLCAQGFVVATEHVVHLCGQGLDVRDAIARVPHHRSDVTHVMHSIDAGIEQHELVVERGRFHRRMAPRHWLTSAHLTGSSCIVAASPWPTPRRPSTSGTVRASTRRSSRRLRWST